MIERYFWILPISFTSFDWLKQIQKNQYQVIYVSRNQKTVLRKISNLTMSYNKFSM